MVTSVYGKKITTLFPENINNKRCTTIAQITHFVFMLRYSSKAFSPLKIILSHKTTCNPKIQLETVWEKYV
jgi:hypothetical protein